MIRYFSNLKKVLFNVKQIKSLIIFGLLGLTFKVCIWYFLDETLLRLVLNSFTNFILAINIMVWSLEHSSDYHEVTEKGPFKNKLKDIKTTTCSSMDNKGESSKQGSLKGNAYPGVSSSDLNSWIPVERRQLYVNQIKEYQDTLDTIRDKMLKGGLSKEDYLFLGKIQEEVNRRMREISADYQALTDLPVVAKILEEKLESESKKKVTVLETVAEYEGKGKGKE